MPDDGRFDAENLRKARIGSHQAFRALVEPYQAELKRHCYRMTGSFDDADDIVQETLFRAWRGLGAYVSHGSFRAWLYRIATNRTLDVLGSAYRRREVVNAAGEPSWLQPYPTTGFDETGDAVTELETVGLAFVVALQNLPGRQRAALLLCDVLGFTPAEAADVLDTTVPATNSLLQRARTTMGRFEPSNPFAVADEDQQALVDRFTKAWSAGDTDAMLALLDESAHLTMPPHELEFFGRTDIVELLLDEIRFADRRNVEFVTVTANGEHGLATYIHEPGGSTATRHCVMLFGAGTDTATKITGFTEDRIFDLLDLPTEIEATPAS
ncbi:MAG: RNA polymerase subunit sigma-70 [Acidimicrobiia bacterium]